MSRLAVMLADLADLIPDAVLDIRYATGRNAFGRALYAKAEARLDARMLPKVAAAAAALRPLRLVVFDGYRPPEAQRLMWELKPDPRYVADPARGSKHGRGAALDCGLADASGRPLDMGSDFDDFSERSAHSFRALDAAVLERRARLRAAMEGAGLRAYDAEWWHYSDPEL
jgi:D-alanyl-D-alanine dipeptidase